MDAPGSDPTTILGHSVVAASPGKWQFQVVFGNRWKLFCLFALYALANQACLHYNGVNRPVPDAFEARRIDGAPVDRKTLQGKPWVLVPWAPW